MFPDVGQGCNDTERHVLTMNARIMRTGKMRRNAGVEACLLPDRKETPYKALQEEQFNIEKNGEEGLHSLTISTIRSK